MERIAYLFRNRKLSHLVVDLNKRFLIAGGSVVYALNHFVPPHSVGDVDFFINSVDDFKEIVHLLLSYGCCKVFVPLVYMQVHFFYLMQYEYSKETAVVSFSFPKETVQIQLIFQEHSTVWDVLETFDLDYVQCGILNGNVFMTEACSQSHSQRKVLRWDGINCPKIYRFEKALLKGFESPVFGNRDSPAKHKQLENSNDVWESRFVSLKKPRTIFTDRLVIESALEVSPMCLCPRVWYRKGFFETENGKRISKIALRINVLGSLWGGVSEIAPVHLGGYIISSARHWFPLPLGEHFVLAGFYKRSNPRLTISKVYSHSHVREVSQFISPQTYDYGRKLSTAFLIFEDSWNVEDQHFEGVSNIGIQVLSQISSASTAAENISTRKQLVS